ncbi:MAG TPA: methylmalonyl Co-A mutase-associated GTPase MeaB [Chitinophagaceae bacterium]|jgi:LAO/AO transport system kinase|nr:methylmalonyl Co-A mutase-associated GTPase MeaB [Chitinophagaceae bacterium]HMU59404.1 methylmalonyl Co-A mutase-associated GTPase MeaB [Chitinophagaceae bacterium]
MWQQLHEKIITGDIKGIARSISLVENEYPGYEELLQMLPASASKITGITGPPGAGKSTLTDALIGQIVNDGKKVAVLCVDPSSPFNLGAVLGDRIRMSDWYTHPNVYIRSLATRGTMGGLHPKIIEITDMLKASVFDHIIVETVGVGQSEIEIAGLADVTVVVVVPEAGDEIQTMKAGLMEIADIFVVNKSDRPDADTFVRNLKQMLAPSFGKHYHEVPVIKTVAARKEGVPELYDNIKHLLRKTHQTDRKFWLLADRAWQLIQQKRMKGIDKVVLKKGIEEDWQRGGFNLYKFIGKYTADQ